MRKLLPLLAMTAFVVLTSTSCKKDYSCECSYKDVIGAPNTYVFDIEDAKKKDAQDACESYTFQGWTEVTCELK